MAERIFGKISVITVVFNDVNNIKETIDSYFSQNWDNKEYIVIDGGSTDGTVEIIKEYENNISYYVSEPDKGIYDAMNKAISKVTGDWICILNSGDTFADSATLSKIAALGASEEADVLYGDSIEITDGGEFFIEAGKDVERLEYTPIYRHGASLIRAEVQKEFLYDLSKEGKLGYALDWDMIYRVYKAGYVFKKIGVTIEKYRKEGVSNHIYKNLVYNYKITSQYGLSLRKFLFMIKGFAYFGIKESIIKRILVGILEEYCVNDILPHIPFWCLRRFYLKMIRAKIGQGSFIMKKNYIMCPHKLFVGEYSHINHGCTIDARGGLTIGNNVSISHNVQIITGGHDLDSPNFRGRFSPITIDDYAWLGAGCIILQNVKVGKGAVICAGSVVTKDVPPYTVVGGIPARKIKERIHNLDYHCKWDVLFT